MSNALKNIRRSPYQALSAILVLGANFFVISILTLVLLISQTILIHFETRPQIIAYLSDTAKQEDVNQTINSIAATLLVKDIRYISKEEALKLYKQSVGDDPNLLGTVTQLGEITADVLPASIEVSVKDPADFDKIISILNKSEVVSSTPKGDKEIDFPRDVFSELTEWTKAVRIFGIAIISAISLASILTTFIIITIKIASRRQETRTLKLIGAKNFYIAKPYLIESVVYTCSGSLIGWVLCLIVSLYSTPFLAERLMGIVTLPIPFPTLIAELAGLLTFAIALGLLSGFIAALKILRK